MKLLVIVFMLSLSSFAQTASLKAKSEAAALKQERDALKLERDQLKAEAETSTSLIKMLTGQRFEPVTIGKRTIHSEDDLVAEFNTLTEKYNALLDRAAAPPPIFVTAPELPHIPVGTESRIKNVAPLPVYCFSNSLVGENGFTTTNTNCN